MSPSLESILFFVFAYKTEKSYLHKYVNENELSSNNAIQLFDLQSYQMVI